MASLGEAGAAAQERLGYRPGLDGLRAVAVALVVWSHVTVISPWVGTAGVLAFLALSGFLITKLLCEENDHGPIDLRTFYLRRARRLLPALPLVLVMCSAVAALDGLAVMRPLLASVFYVQNLNVGMVGDRSTFNHLWSLSLEEQFYAVWPLVVVAAPRVARRVAMWAVPVFLVAKIGLAGTDVGGVLRGAGFLYVDALLGGAWLAFVMHERGLPRVRWPFAAGAAFAIGAFAWSRELPVDTFGLTVFAVGSVVLVAWATNIQWVPTPLLWAGRRSYGIYLWHVPVTWLLGWNLLGVVSSLLAAECSWRWIESRFMSRRAREQQTDHAHIAAHGVVGVRPVALDL